MTEETVDQVAEPIVEQTAPAPEQSEGHDDQPVVEEKFIEYERDGKKYQLPEALKDDLLRQQDYTRKTQEIAEMRRAEEARIQAEKEAITREREFVKANREYVKVTAQLEELQAITPEQWEAWMQQNPSVAQAAFIRKQALKDHADAIAAKVQQDEQRRAFETQQTTAKRIEQAIADVRAAIPDWSDKKQVELKNYAKSLGASEDSAAKVTEAWIVKALHKAALYDQTLKGATAPSASPVATPIKTVQGPARVNQDPDKMSVAEWMKWDDERQRKRRA